MINIHVDVDNLWMYEQEFDISIHPDREYIYSQSLPVFLKLLQKTKSKATFMIIGKDLELPACQAFCRKAIRAGHEIANHTWSHPISFGKLSYEQKKQQIVKTHKKIIAICGKTPVGFRGAGYYYDKDIITILQQLHYLYDSSVLPGYANLLMTTYAAVKGGENRHKTFGRTNYLFSPDHPFIFKEEAKIMSFPRKRESSLVNTRLLELPISVLPLIRLPIHTTFAYFFGEKYRQLILRYLKSKPSYVLYLFHAIDFVDLPQRSDHPIIPLQYAFDERMKFVESIVDTLVAINGGALQTSRVSLEPKVRSRV